MLNRFNAPISQSSKKIIFYLLMVGLLYIVVYAYGKSEPNRFQVWQVGDWLINYSGGFVRRGLSGFLLIGLANLINIRPELVVFFVKLIFYSVIYLGIIWIIRKIKITTFEAAILVSPVTYFFPILDTMGGGRKELILLAGISILAIMAIKNIKAPSPSQLGMVLLVFTALHEGLAFFYPLLIVLIPVIIRRERYNFKEVIFILWPSTFFMFFLLLGAPKVDDELILKLTIAIDPVNFERWSGGAIDALRWTTRYTLNEVASKFGVWSLVSTCGAIILFIAPFFLSKTSRLIISNIPISKRALALAFIAQLPLFILALDWGRWLYINASVLSLTYFTFRVTRDLHINSQPDSVIASSKSLNEKKSIGVTFFILVIILITTTWKVDHCCVSGAGWGLLVKPLIVKNF